jgi:two-component system, LytTR family, response regulator
MTAPSLSVIVADDERPARRFLTGLLKNCPGVELAGEAASGDEAITLICSARPHLALLDLQMPEVGGLDVVRRVPADVLPFVAFVTAFDDHAIEAFELNAIDYLLKPVRHERLLATIERARGRVREREPKERHADALARATTAYEHAGRRQYAERLPLRARDKVVLVPVRTIMSVVADGELLRIRTVGNETYTISHRLHALESRLDPRRFLRLGRGTLANIEMISHVHQMPGGTYVAVLTNGDEMNISRMQSRVLRETLLKL